MPATLQTMVELLEEHAALQPAAIALRFLSDRGGIEQELTFADLRHRAVAVAHELLARGAKPRDRALLAFPPGLDFMVAWFGCLYACVIGVPMMPPRRANGRDASASIIADCTPRFAFTSAAFAHAIREDMMRRTADFHIDWILLDASAPATTTPSEELRKPTAADLAFLQYTSGSTSSPKGVMVSHGNLIANLEMIRLAFGNTPQSTYVSWVPLYHDMGLILNVLAALYAGASTILMSPVSFLQRPLTWLRAISDFKADVAGGPNFSFDHCVARFQDKQMEGIDLSSWKLAFNAAEPVRAKSLQRFSETFAPYGFDAHAFYPCYGMAEATVLMSGRARGNGAAVVQASTAALQRLRSEKPVDEADTQPIVGCGHAAPGTQLAIVDADTKARLAKGHIGEIWGRGDNVAQGYWGKPEATLETFGAMIASEMEGPWLRTGDLGFLDESGNLFVVGRLKDLIIIRGRNYYPQDIEYTVQSADKALRPGFGAAFTILMEDEERLVIVQEIERTQRNRTDLSDIIGNIREAIAEVHELSAYRVVLVPPGTIPKTTSGKIQRRLTRELWQTEALESLLQL